MILTNKIFRYLKYLINKNCFYQLLPIWKDAKTILLTSNDCDVLIFEAFHRTCKTSVKRHIEK